MRRILLAAAVLIAGCKEPPPAKPIAGIHSAAKAVLQLSTKGAEPRPYTVGSQLMPGDHLRASGPAVIEYYGGGILFLDDGDKITVGETTEAELVGSNIPEQIVKGKEVEDAPRVQRIVAGRYVTATFTPVRAGGGDLGTSDYLQAFFTPNGISNLGKGSGPSAEGPRRKLPAPPNRVRVPHIHAGELGEGGVVAEVEDGYAAAETPEMTTAILLEDEKYELGTTTRLLLPDGAEVTLTYPDGAEVELDGPGDFKLR